MARRDWGVLIREDGPAGGEDAVSRGMAVGYRFGPEVIESVFDVLATLERLGGQFAVQVLRSKYDAQGNRIPQAEHKSVDGQYVTDGFVFSYESRDAALGDIKPPNEDEIEELMESIGAEEVSVEEPHPQAVPEEAAA